MELEEKRLELLKAVIPRLQRVAVLANTANPLNRVNLDTARRAAQRLGVTIEAVDIKSSKDVEGALVQIKGLRPDAVLLASDNVLLVNENKEWKRWRRTVSQRSTHFGNMPMSVGYFYGR